MERLMKKWTELFPTTPNFWSVVYGTSDAASIPLQSQEWNTDYVEVVFHKQRSVIECFPTEQLNKIVSQVIVIVLFSTGGLDPPGSQILTLYATGPPGTWTD